MSTLIQLVDPALRQLMLRMENKFSEMLQEASKALLKINEAQTPTEMQERDYLQALVNETAKSIVSMNEFANLEVEPGVTDEEFLAENKVMLETYRQQLTQDLERATELISQQKALAMN